MSTYEEKEWATCKVKHCPMYLKFTVLNKVTFPCRWRNALCSTTGAIKYSIMFRGVYIRCPNVEYEE